MLAAGEGQAMEPTGGARAPRGKRAGSPRLKPGGKGAERHETQRWRDRGSRGPEASDRHTDRKGDAEREREGKETGRVGGDGDRGREM